MNDGSIGYNNMTIRNIEGCLRSRKLAASGHFIVLVSSVYNTGSLDQATPETNECFYLGCNNVRVIWHTVMCC